MDKIILFDGDCNFCDNSVHFIIKRDNKDIFKFTSIQSENGTKLRNKYKIPNDIDSVILIEDNIYRVKSSAALHICKDLKGFWKIFYLLIIVPKPIRDYFYDIVAKNRYKWFGKRNTCMLPTKEERKKFL